MGRLSQLGLVLLLAASAGGCAVVQLAAVGDARALRAEPERVVRPGEPTVLLVALDGVGRTVLYDMLETGELPELHALLGGGEGVDLPHAYLDRTLLSTLPSSTLAAWSTVFTGQPPAVHGVAGNEYFMRETRRLAAPAPVSIVSMDPTAQAFTDDYVNRLLAVPTIYEEMHARHPSFSAWVSLSQVFRGADRLLLTQPSLAIEAFGAMLAGAVGDDANLMLFRHLDGEAIGTVVEQLDQRPSPPRMLTVYLTGTDLYEHSAVSGPEVAVRRYLREVIDPLLGRLRRALAAHHTLEDRYVIVVSDHGHTAVMHDDAHALTAGDGPDEPPAVVRGAGFRLRPFQLEVADTADFDAVLAYGGATAFAYVADRSTCPTAATRCDWSRPARYEEDTLPLAEAFFRANAEGLHAPGMRGTLDMILVRHARPLGQDALPFDVYLGGGHVEPLAAHLAAHPRTAYVALEARLRDLAAGPMGHHAGDILLLARNGNEPSVENRYYFAASLYHSWHGSPSRADSEIPLIVAQPSQTTTALARRVRAALGAEPRQSDLARLIESLLYPASPRP